MDRGGILKTLLDQVGEATETHRLCQQYFQAVINEIPSGLPHPDGVQRIANASTECAYARSKMRAARDRLKLFQDYGLIPDDLE